MGALQRRNDAPNPRAGGRKFTPFPGDSQEFFERTISNSMSDTETGLVIIRYYDPGTGRFINRDPIRAAGGINLYGFVGNEPAAEKHEMAIKQFIVTVMYEYVKLDDEGQEYRGGRVVDVDLCRESVEEFLARIPDDINDHSVLMVTITRPDGKMISFADGITMIDTDAGPDAAGAYRRLYQFEDNYDDKLRHTSSLWAARSLTPPAGASLVGPKDAAEPTEPDS